MNKGDKQHPNIRARLVARHIVAKFGGNGLIELFVAMPPFEMITYLILRLMRCPFGTAPRGGDLKRNDKRRKMLFIDVSKAHLYAPQGRLFCVCRVACGVQ